ncbi:hypothetical protein Vadar_013950 [Vaccinium darrowii]|uniref:Uncharacterized protein n=1 Tax=Vaccinium darrowii TaxID=229202 RepID=A0ACB7ZBM0_9ERIC|nr:hypothetical protein Vadar_013950 [Vaccinium darrowii]
MKGLFSHKVKSSELAPGDHIYVYRKGGTYSHHGIFVGENTVIHYMQKAEGSSSSTTISGLISSFSSSTTLAASEKIFQSTCSKGPDCGLRQPGNGVALSCLDCFLGNKKLRRYQYEVTGGEFKAKLRGGTCTIAKSDPPEKVIRRARYLLEAGFGNYNLSDHNCEDFALYCKTGLLIPNEEAFGTSGQINSVQAALSSVGDHLSVIEYTRTYNETRYSKDIGVRKDAMEVPVENVASILNRREGHNLEYPKKKTTTIVRENKLI